MNEPQKRLLCLHGVNHYPSQFLTVTLLPTSLFLRLHFIDYDLPIPKMAHHCGFNGCTVYHGMADRNFISIMDEQNSIKGYLRLNVIYDAVNIVVATWLNPELFASGFNDCVCHTLFSLG